MRTRSAYIRSFGVTGILVSASVMMLAIVSAIVAFDGWPTSASARGVETVAIDVPTGRAASETPVIRVRAARKPSRPAPARAVADRRTGAADGPRALGAPSSP